MSSEQRRVVVIPSIATTPIPKSKVKIFNALRSLAGEKEFDRISVREICDAAKISKSTFYANFPDKYAIIHWHYDMVMESGVNKIGRTLSWEEGHFITSFGFAAELPLYRMARKSIDQHGLLPYGLRKRESVLIETLSDYRKVNVTDKLRFQVTALAAAEQAVVGKYLNSPDPIDVSAYVDNMLDIIPRALYDALQIDGREQGAAFANSWDSLFS